MSNLGITFNGKHSYKDFGLRLIDRDPGVPSKRKNKQRVPHSNVVYDFSGIYGDQEYEERTLTYIFNLKDYDKIHLETKKTAVINWLMNPNEKSKLVDDYIPGYYFLAEVEQGIDFDELRFNGRLTVGFTAYPYRIAEREEGHDIWDEFNFLLDVAQITKFDVAGTSDVTLHNPGIAKAYPIINASAPMEIVKEGITYSVPIGQSQSFDFFLTPGKNDFKINGNGTISFHFRKELI